MQNPIFQALWRTQKLLILMIWWLLLHIFLATVLKRSCHKVKIALFGMQKWGTIQSDARGENGVRQEMNIFSSSISVLVSHTSQYWCCLDILAWGKKWKEFFMEKEVKAKNTFAPIMKERMKTSSLMCKFQFFLIIIQEIFNILVKSKSKIFESSSFRRWGSNPDESIWGQLAALVNTTVRTINL